MRLQSDPRQMMNLSSDLLALSRQLRGFRFEIDDIQRALLPISELDGVKRALSEQGEALSVLVARIVNLSSGLQESAELYVRAERKNGDMLESEAHWQPAVPLNGTLFFSNGELDSRLQQVLNQEESGGAYGTINH